MPVMELSSTTGNDVSAVVADLRRAGHAGMEERRVAQNAEYLFVGLSGALERLRHAHGDCEAAAHADAAVQRVQRRRKAERIAADVARDDKVLVAGHGVEEAAVRAAWTQRGRTRDGRDADVYSLGRVAEDTLAQQLRIQLVELAGQLLAGAGDTGGADLLLHEGVKLLDDVELFDLRGEFADERHRQGLVMPSFRKEVSSGKASLAYS